jgi:hypothetical protein
MVRYTTYVLFPQVAHEPAHNNGSGPLPWKDRTPIVYSTVKNKFDSH